MNMLGIILAGGKSTRMRQDKALLSLGGISLLQHQFQTLERFLGQGNVIVSGERPPFPHIKDLCIGLGPLEGVRSVCHHFVGKEDYRPLLIVPVDMPYMTELGFRRLFEEAGKKDITKFSGQQLPFVINELSTVVATIETMKEDSLSFKNLFSKVRVQEISAEPNKFFINLNTPEDWDAAISSAGDFTSSWS